MKADFLRQAFLEFFKSKKHKIVESDSLIPKDDPTVLFTPAGMNQFKRQFLGQDIRFRRAASCQRCLRTDDLDKVGKTSGHHTFFEMLGNFSFGDYFKPEAISWAWEFLTGELKIDKERLWVSVYREDEEAYNIWKEKIALPAGRIVRLGDKENFWPSEAKEKGPNGPCGPCSEIFFDLGPGVGCGRNECNPGCGCGRFIEVWNLVFTQFNRTQEGILQPLPQKNIDTGMGLERLTAVMCKAANNFETELFLPLIEQIISLKKEENFPKESVYAVADHIRAVTFSIFDGIMPSNEGRGYVIRKLIRKSLLHLYALGQHRPFLYKLVPVVAHIMRQPYPELELQREDISQVVLAEEKAFLATLNSSDQIMQEKFAPLFKKLDLELAGRIVFQLYDTYGIPPELCQQWLTAHNLNFSSQAFEQELEMQKRRSQAKSAMRGEVFSGEGIKLSLPATKFLGYSFWELKAKVLAVMKDAQGKDILILDQTPFYPESGGQKGDSGVISNRKNKFIVEDTQKSGKVILHIGSFAQGSFKKSSMVLCKVDIQKRMATARNHTATHLLQAALKKVLGEHVRQQGSLVAADRLRFDFTHFKDISNEELRRIEELVNTYIMEDHPLIVRKMSLVLAKKTGALAFFAEKYDKTVRVVSVEGVSKELCGGTHLKSTGQIGIFKIIQEGSVASGIRRIEAITGTSALQSWLKEREILQQAASILNTSAERLVVELENRLRRIKELEKQLSSKNRQDVAGLAEDLLLHAEKLDSGIKLVFRLIEDMDINALRQAVDLIKNKTQGCVVFLAAKKQEKAIFVLGLTSDLVDKGLSAVEITREITSYTGGSGGGRADFVQAGGMEFEKIKQAFEILKQSLNSKAL